MGNKKKFGRRTNRITMADQLGDYTLDVVRKHGSKLSEVEQNDTHDGEVEYSMPTFLRLYKGYDFLENMIYTMPYICRKYDFERKEFLLVLLNLYPKNIFSLRDFAQIRFVRFGLRKIYLLENRDLVRCIFDAKVEGDRLFQLTLKGRKIVEEFYKLLSGEVEMDLTIWNKSDFAIDKRYRGATEKLQQSEPNKTQMSFWTRKKVS